MNISDLDKLVSHLNENFEYCKTTGYFFRKTSAGRIKKGKRAGGKDSNGYRTIQFKKIRLYEHRAAFLLIYGYLPSQVDHIDGDPSNNRISNLRDGTLANARNRRRSKNNSSGFTGVSRCTQPNRWRAYIFHKGEQLNLCGFEDKLEAAKFREILAAMFYGDHAKQQEVGVPDFHKNITTSSPSVILNIKTESESC